KFLAQFISKRTYMDAAETNYVSLSHAWPKDINVLDDDLMLISELLHMPVGIPKAIIKSLSSCACGIVDIDDHLNERAVTFIDDIEKVAEPRTVAEHHNGRRGRHRPP